MCPTPSLRELVLVAHDRRSVELWRRDADGWQRNDVTSGLVQLEAIDCTLAIDDVYYDPLATD